MKLQYKVMKLQYKVMKLQDKNQFGQNGVDKINSAAMRKFSIAAEFCPSKKWQVFSVCVVCVQAIKLLYNAMKL